MQACAGRGAAVLGPPSNKDDHPRGESHEPVVEVRGHAEADETRAWRCVAVRAASEHITVRYVVERQAAVQRNAFSFVRWQGQASLTTERSFGSDGAPAPGATPRLLSFSAEIKSLCVGWLLGG